MQLTEDAAHSLDATDPLAAIRDLFELPEGLIYMDANSVGPMPKSVRARASALLDDWVRLRQLGWSERAWQQMPSLLGDAIAPFIGAGKGEVVFADSTTLNQFKAVSHALAINRGRSVMLTQNSNFPTDVHVLQGLVEHSRGQLSLRFVDNEDAAVAAFDDSIAVAAFSHVDYRSGDRWNMARVTAAAHAAGALTVWDLCHSAGAVPVDVEGANADFAIGCGNKYLCGGPGSPAFIYARKGLADRAFPAIAGWMGHADVLAFTRDYVPHQGVKRFITGTPLVGADELAGGMLDIWPQIEPRALWAKHKSLTDFLIGALRQQCGPLGVEVISPDDYDRRGGNVTFRAPGADAIVEALIAQGVIASFRNPDAIRFGVSPLVIRHQDCLEAVMRLRRVLESDQWQEAKYAKASN